MEIKFERLLLRVDLIFEYLGHLLLTLLLVYLQLFGVVDILLSIMQHHGVVGVDYRQLVLPEHRKSTIGLSCSSFSFIIVAFEVVQSTKAP